MDRQAAGRLSKSKRNPTENKSSPYFCGFSLLTFILTQEKKLINDGLNFFSRPWWIEDSWNTSGIVVTLFLPFTHTHTHTCLLLHREQAGTTTQPNTGKWKCGASRTKKGEKNKWTTASVDWLWIPFCYGIKTRNNYTHTFTHTVTVERRQRSASLVLVWMSFLWRRGVKIIHPHWWQSRLGLRHHRSTRPPSPINFTEEEDYYMLEKSRTCVCVCVCVWLCASAGVPFLYSSASQGNTNSYHQGASHEEFPFFLSEIWTIKVILTGHVCEVWRCSAVVSKKLNVNIKRGE